MKRTVALFLTFGMLLCILTGCGQVTDPVPQTTETTQAPPTTVPTASTAAPTEPPYQFPAGASLLMATPEYVEGTLFEQLQREITGLDLTYLTYAEGFTCQPARDKADIEVCSSMKDLDDYSSYGRYVNLLEYRDSMPNFFAIFDSEAWAPYRELYMASETELYCAPVPKRFGSQYNAWIYREDIFRELNLEPPTDWESFYTLLKTLKAACPESYPLVIWGLDYSLTGFQKFAQQFGVDYIAKGFPSGEDGLYYDPVSTEEMRLMLTRLRQLIVEELLHPDCLNGELGGQWRNALKEGSSFIAHYPVISLQALEDAGRKTNPDFSLSCFQNIPMVDSALPFTTRIPSVEGYYWTVIHDAEDIDLAVRYLDWLYSEEGIEALSWGKEGVTFEVDEAGNKHYTDTVLQDSRLKALFASERLSGYIDQEAVLVNYSEKNIQLLLETVTSAEAGGFQTPLPLEHFVPELRKAFNRYFSGYMWIRQKYIENFLTGELDIRNDAHWQEMKDALETNGVSQLLEAYNTACQANNRE